MQTPQNFNRPALLPPREALNALLADELRLLDLRAPVEFYRGHIPGSWNGPILDDAERQQVGTTYKEQGQEAAVRLGHELVAPHRLARVAAWKAWVQDQKALGKQTVVTCWRGGLRSATAQEWLSEAGLSLSRLEGGYKALRALLLEALERPLQGYVITGRTGSGKTAFLRSLSYPAVVDLEALAHHRGSAFGGMGSQPAQQTFENALGLALEKSKNRVLLEDESRLVGRCVLPDTFFQGMRELPRIALEEGLPVRVENLYREYVAEPLRSESPEKLKEKLERSLLTLKNRLGGAACQEILTSLRQAFAQGDETLHRHWVQQLLELYYDKVYAHSAQRSRAPVLFQGNAEACRQFLADLDFFR